MSSSPRPSRRDQLSARIKKTRSSTRQSPMNILSPESSFGSPTSKDSRRVDSFDMPDDMPADEKFASCSFAEAETDEAAVAQEEIADAEGEGDTPPAAEEAVDTPAAADDDSEEEEKKTETLQVKTSSPPASPSRHDRVPGGAAAKIMLVGPSRQRTHSSDNEEEFMDAISSDLNDISPNQTTEEIGQIMEQTKNEFATGSPKNRRYNTVPLEATAEDRRSRAKTPNILNPAEIFYPDADAAITALLTPREQPAMFSSDSMLSQQQELLSVVSSGVRSNEGTISNKMSHDTMATAGSSKGNDMPSGELLSATARAKVEALREGMQEPDKSTRDLLEVIAEPEEITLHSTVRRKNACGALQILSSNVKNRVSLCWTMGVLPALTSVLNNDDVSGTYQDPRHRREFLAARERAIVTLMNLSTPPANRIAMFHTPHLVPTLVSLIDHDKAARRGCAAILAYLAKSTDNRLLLAKVPGLVKSIVQVIIPRLPVQSPTSEATSPARSKAYPWSDEDSEASDDRNESFLTNNTSFTSNGAETLSVNPSVDVASNDAGLMETGNYLFAVISHMVKEKDNAYVLCRNNMLVSTLVRVAQQKANPSHALALRILANFTRHRLNSKLLVFNQQHPAAVVPTIVNGTQSTNEEARQYSCWALQNLTQDKACRQQLATTEHLVECLCDRARHGGEERLASISALKNLSDEPANLIPMTNTPDCVATLMHIAHSEEDVVQFRACDSLATLSHWLRKIATQRGQPLMVPTLEVVSWNQWQ